MKKAAFILAAFLLGACAAQGPPQALPLDADERAKFVEAAQALGGETYLGFKRAFHLYSELYARPKLRQAAAESFARAGLLLGVRAKELGILDPEPLETVGRLIAENPDLAAYQPLLEVAGLIALKSKGIMGEGDSRIERYLDRPADLKKLLGTLVDRWTSDVLAAYVLASFHCFYPYQGIGLELEDFVRQYPSSLLFAFVKATCSEEDPVLLQSFLERRPTFAEAHYFLGNVSLSRGLLVEAEGLYEKAHAAIPESPQVTICLAGVAFAEEDYERCLDFYDKTLALVPGYREAILGKAVSLTSLGRFEEAKPLLEDLIRQGKYLMGEAHFWLAWNEHELCREAEASENIGRAKKLLGNSQVYVLSGAIDLGLGDEEGALQNFQEALKYSPHEAEAFFQLGGIHARRRAWDMSGTYYRMAGEEHEIRSSDFQERLKEIMGSALPEERKARLARRKTAQLEQSLLTGGTAYYNAAAGFINAGEPDKALPCALKAASYPALKGKAEELVRKLRSRS